MKKFFIGIVYLFTILFALFSQETVNQQYESFSWEPVTKVRKYGVQIDRFNQETEVWESYKTEKTKETSVEYLFDPGIYRVSISTYNIFGGKSSSTDWVTFKILSENIPYLFANYYKKFSPYGLPVLYADVSSFEDENPYEPEKNTYLINSKHASASDVPGLKDDELKNTFFIHGKNIFAPNTKFSLVPIDAPEGIETKYEASSAKRKTVELELLQRNTKKSGVYVKYDPEALYSGYYAIEARNSGDNISRIPILVIIRRNMEIEPDTGFIVDSRYNVNSITLNNEENYTFGIKGEGFGSTDSFYLEPTSGTNAYPFESGLDRDAVSAQVQNVFDDGEAFKLNLSVNIENLKSGYYNVYVKRTDPVTSAEDTDKFLVLIKRPFSSDAGYQVKKIKTKYNKKTKQIDFTITGVQLSEDYTYTLVSEYLPDTNSNIRLTLDPKKNSLSGKFLESVTPESLIFGNYAIMVEDGDKAVVAYYITDNHYKTRMQKLSQEKADKIFLRPDSNSKDVTLDEDEEGSITFENDLVQVEKRMPYFFPYIRLTGTTNVDMLTNGGAANIDLRLETDALNFDFFYLDAGVKVNFHLDDESVIHPEIAPEVHFKFALNSYLASPYIGLGLGYSVMDPNTGFTNWFGHDLLVSAEAGVTLFQFFDVRYNLELHHALNLIPSLSSYGAPYFRDTFTLGVRIPIRRVYYQQHVLSQGVRINKTGVVDGSDYTEITDKVTSVIIENGTKVVQGFANRSGIQKVIIPNSVEELGQDAFRNCQNLTSFDISYGQDAHLKTIRAGAFADDDSIVSITIPKTVTLIEAGAFENWVRGQTIRLGWDSTDTTPRDLTGLNGLKCSIIYNNGVRLTPDPRNLLEIPENWYLGSVMSTAKMGLVVDGMCHPAIRFIGNGKQSIVTYTLTSPEPVVEELQSGNGIEFTTYGDGKKYKIYLCSRTTGQRFEYEFKTKNKQSLHIKIPYSKFKEIKESGARAKVDINNIDSIYIGSSDKNNGGVCLFIYDVEVMK